MSKPIQFEGRPVWAEISLKAILHNLASIRKHVGAERMVLAVVKSNAYGLGAVPIAKALQKAGTEWFGVTCANEGIELREAGIRRRILLLTGFWPGEEKRLIKNELTPTVSRLDDLGHLERAAAKAFRGKSRLQFHLKINTGMNRLGISPDEVDEFCRRLKKCPHIELEGTYTHFASAEDFIAKQTSDQELLFRSCLDRMKTLGVPPGIVHMANSGAISARPSTLADMVRPGAILYGYYQSFDPPQKKQEVMGQMPLEPCLTPARTNHFLARRSGGRRCGIRGAVRHQAPVTNRRNQRGLRGRCGARTHQPRICATEGQRVPWSASFLWI
jgi:alanine racemase